MAVYTITATNSRFETSKNAFEDKTNGADTLTIKEGGYLIALNSNLGARLDESGPWTVNVHGSIFAENDHAILLASGGATKSTSTITIGASGQVASEGSYAIQAFSSVKVINAGILEAGSSTVVSLNGNKGASSLTNTATGVIGDSGQFNAITSVFGGDNITVTNSGLIYGNIDLDVGNDVVTNNKIIDGNVDLGDGNNRYTSTKSTSEVGNIAAGSGNDTVSLAGEAGDISLGSGKNSITITKTGDAEALITDTGDDTISIAGFVRQVVLAGDGKNSIMIAATGTIYNAGASINAILMGNGNDTFSNAGRIDGNVDAGLGDNLGTNKGLIEGYVAFGDNNDKFSNAGTITGDVYLGNGINFLTNSGAIEGKVMGGANADTLTNSKSIDVVDLGDGADVLNNSGFISTSLKMGDGADKVVNTGGILSADLGKGDDHYTGGKYFDYVRDGDGLDTIKLGAGDDYYIATGAASGKDGDDIIDGGTGADIYYAGDSTSDLRINLDTAAHDFKALLNTGLNLPDNVSAAQTATDVTGASDTGKDAIAGFEHVYGGQGDDRIWGSSAANVFVGYDGNDALIGLGGNDLLYGGKGGDQLIGGAGADELWGGDGSGPDGVIDVFYVLTAKDSGITKSTRDRIMDFEDGKDLINLSGIDANTTLGGVQNFDYINDNGGPGQTAAHANFTGVAGQLRSYYTATGQMIEGDVNGDGKADLSIELYDPDHSIILTSVPGTGDFILF
jgi:hypothetical protein